MHRRRKTHKPKPCENLDLRKEYAEVNQKCELWQHRYLLWQPCWDPELPRTDVRNSSWYGWTEIHHIWRRGGRWDLWSNLIRVASPWHVLAHGKGGELLRLACVWVKYTKGETDWEEMDRAAGQCVLAWCERLADLPPEYEKMREELPL